MADPDRLVIERVARSGPDDLAKYEVTIRGLADPVPVVRDHQTTNLPVLQLDNAGYALGEQRFPMLLRLVSEIHKGRQIPLPVDLELWFQGWESARGGDGV